jgi:tripartite-type tricarboxylate transporter receptor subunit TctC
MPNVRRQSAIALCLMLLTVGAADAWPDQPVRIVVPFAAGGTTDIMARVIGEKLAPRLGQPVIIENIGGAGGNTGAAQVAKSPPNGATLLMSTPGPAVMNQFMYSRMPYDTATAFAPVVHVASIPSVLIVGPKVEAKTVSELVALMKAKPGGFNFGSAGNGSTGHLGGSLFKSVAGVEAQHVPYRGSGPMLQDLMAGNIQFTIDSLPGALSLIQAASVRALAVTTAKRWPELPDLPTIAEAGLPDVQVATWVALLTPAGTPRAVIEQLNREINAVLADADLRRRMVGLGAAAEGGSSDALAAFLQSETTKWKRAVAAGAKME